MTQGDENTSPESDEDTSPDSEQEFRTRVTLVYSYIPYKYAIDEETERLCLFRSNEQSYQFVCNKDFRGDAYVTFVNSMPYALSPSRRWSEIYEESARHDIERKLAAAKAKKSSGDIAVYKSALNSIETRMVWVH